MKKHKLSKSSFLKGAQCVKSLWLTKNMPELMVPKSFEEKVQMEKGTEIGILARNLFPGGIDVSQGGVVRAYDLIDVTKKALESGHKILYEAGFATPDLSVRFLADIFVVDENETKLIEIKSSTAIKPEHILDAAIQWYVLKQSGYERPLKAFVGHLNNEYIRQGELELDKLFVLKDVTEQVKAKQEQIKKYLSQFEFALELKTSPVINIGEHCFKPYECEFKSHCWSHVPEYSVFDLSRIRKSVASKLFNEGIRDIKEIPADTKLSENQWLEIDAAIDGAPHINQQEIKSFLDLLNWNEPMVFMDFESFMPACPIYDNSRPYQQLCFQYCVLIKENNNNELIRKEFLAEHSTDPRENFIKNLLEDTKGSGDVIVYNASFENSRLKELAELFPQYAKEINELIGRVKDLMTPFKNKDYYHSKFKGSYSIKAVLPVLVPELSYSTLQISNGGLAMNAFEQLHKLSHAEQMQTRKDLLEYCHLDVMAMVRIIEALQKIVTNKK